MRDAYLLEEFTASVAAELRLRGLAFHRADLEEFMRCMGELVFERDDVAWWADTFQEALANAGRPAEAW